MRIISKTCLALGLLTTLAIGQTSPATKPAPKFLRFVEDAPGSAHLDAAVVRYKNPQGVTVDLIAAIHIADASFYESLNESFTHYDSLLYEMVKPRGMKMPARDAAPPPPDAPRRSLSWVSSLQHFMKDTLSLTFQLDEIDYTKPNFVHADLDVESFEQMQADRGESMLTLMLQAMLREMAKDQPENQPQMGMMDLVVALQSPDRAKSLKLLLGREFAESDELMTALDGPNGSVLVTERNKAAIKVLRERIAAGDKKIGIFYGAAHLPGMEKMLILDLGFKREGEPVWRTAWDMRAPATAPAIKP